MAKFKKMAKVLTDAKRKERDDHAITKAQEVSWADWFQGYPVDREFASFLVDLSAAMPTAKFYPNDMYRTVKHVEITTADHVPGHENISFYVMDEFLVYMDEYPFELGRVNYKNNSTSGYSSSNKTFGVYSRKIDNAKYQPHRDQRNMIMSTDPKKAIKTARTYLVPYTHAEMATILYSNIQEPVEKVQSQAESKVWSLGNTMRGNDVITELMHLSKLGVEFKTEAFREAANKIGELMGKVDEEKRRSVSALFARVRTTDGFTFVDVIEAHDLRKNHVRPVFGMGTQPTTYSNEEVPEDIAGAISVLSILEDGQYVERVGQKFDATTYWIERG